MTVTGAPDGMSLAVTMEAGPGIAAVEREWYAVTEDGIEPVGKPRTDLFAGLRAAFWRQVYKADQTSIVAGADTLAELDSVTTRVLSGSEPCARCVAIPRFVGINAFRAVMVNGREVRVSLGSNLGSVIRAAGVTPEQVMPPLAIEKRYAGKMIQVVFEGTRPDVMDLVMEGNETVRW